MTSSPFKFSPIIISNVCASLYSSYLFYSYTLKDRSSLGIMMKRCFKIKIITMDNKTQVNKEGGNGAGRLCVFPWKFKRD